MPGFPLSVLRRFSLCGSSLFLSAISGAWSPHPKIRFLADKALAGGCGFVGYGSVGPYSLSLPSGESPPLLEIYCNRYDVIDTPQNRLAFEVRIIEMNQCDRISKRPQTTIIAIQSRHERLRCSVQLGLTSRVSAARCAGLEVI